MSELKYEPMFKEVQIMILISYRPGASMMCLGLFRSELNNLLNHGYIYTSHITKYGKVGQLAITPLGYEWMERNGANLIPTRWHNEAFMKMMSRESKYKNVTPEPRYS